MQWLNKVLDRLSVVFGALIFSQLPNFILQYRQQLVGRISELQLQVGAIRKVASTSNRSLEEFINKFSSHSDSDFSSQGQLMSGMVARLQELSHALMELDQASLLTQPFVFLRYVNFDVVSSTWSTFEVGVLLTFEGIVYALIGMFLGYGIYFAISKAIVKTWQRLRGL